MLLQEELLALTDCASEDVLEAMNQFVTRLMGENPRVPRVLSPICGASDAFCNRHALTWSEFAGSWRWRLAADAVGRCNEPTCCPPRCCSLSHAACKLSLFGCGFARRAGMEEEAWQGGTSDCTAGELAQVCGCCCRCRRRRCCRCCQEPAGLAICSGLSVPKSAVQLG